MVIVSGCQCEPRAGRGAACGWSPGLWSLVSVTNVSPSPDKWPPLGSDTLGVTITLHRLCRDAAKYGGKIGTACTLFRP